MIYLKLTLMAALWGAAFVGVRYVAQFVGPFTGAATRFFIATIALAFAMKAWRGLPTLSASQWGALLLLGATGVFAYNALFFVGMKNVEAARGALVIAINPAVVAVCAALFMGESFVRRQKIGVFLSFLGGATVVGGGGENWLKPPGVGEWALLGCVCSWIIYSLLGKKTLAHLPPLPVVFLATAIGALPLIIVAFIVETPFTALLQMPPSAWLWLFITGVCSTGMGNLWYYEGIAVVGAARAANFINFVPIFAGLLGIFILAETPSVILLVGGALVICGVWLVNKR